MMMKKLFLFLTVAVLGISLSSCLTGGKQRFSEVAIVYLEQSDLPPYSTYGKTHSGNGITNAKIELMQPGTFKMFYYNWEEDFGTTPIGNGSLLNVEINGDITDIATTTLFPGEAESRGDAFKEIGAPIYIPEGIWFDDYWVIQYSYVGKEGQIPNVKFTLRPNDEDDTSTLKTLKVDMRLTLTGEPGTDAKERTLSSAVAVDMNYIRDQYLFSKGDQVDIRFYYFNDKDGDAVSSQNDWAMKYYSTEN